MYHPGTPCIPQVLRCCGFLCTTNFIPGGTRGVLLKSNYPSIVVCDAIVSFHQQGLRIFEVIVASGMRREPRCIEKLLSVIDSLTMK